MKKAVFILLLTSALLTACGKSDNAAKPNDSMNHSDHGSSTGTTMDHSGMSHDTDTAKDADVQATFALSPDKPQPNQDTTITINLKDKAGNPIDKLDTVHEKQLHLIVVSKDLSYFNHIHPENKGGGQFTITTQFPTAGDFKVIADFTPTGMGAINKSQWLTVQGNGPAAKPVEPETTLTKVVEGKEITLTFDHLMANMELNMNFNIKDAQTKQPIADLQPYLGAVGHVVILSLDAENYLHVHPTEESAKGPDAKFMTTFPHNGIYKIWGQFQHNGKVITVPFVVKVP